MVHFMYFNQLPTKDLDAIKSALMGKGLDPDDFAFAISLPRSWTENLKHEEIRVFQLSTDKSLHLSALPVAWTEAFKEALASGYFD